MCTVWSVSFRTWVSRATMCHTHLYILSQILYIKTKLETFPLFSLFDSCITLIHRQDSDLTHGDQRLRFCIRFVWVSGLPWANFGCHLTFCKMFSASVSLKYLWKELGTGDTCQIHRLEVNAVRFFHFGGCFVFSLAIQSSSCSLSLLTKLDDLAFCYLQFALIQV